MSFIRDFYPFKKIFRFLHFNCRIFDPETLSKVFFSCKS